jgi:hypothetical protein
MSNGLGAAQGDRVSKRREYRLPTPSALSRVIAWAVWVQANYDDDNGSSLCVCWNASFRNRGQFFTA